MRYVALTAPFLVVLLAVPLVVGAAGDYLGAELGRAMVAPPRPTSELNPGAPTAWLMPAEQPRPKIAQASADGGTRWTRLARGEQRDGGASDGGAEAGAGADLLHDRASGTIVVPRNVVERALRKKDIGAANAVSPDGSPLGVRLGGVTRYLVGLRDGDVVVSVEGTRTLDVGAMVTAALATAAAGGNAVHGRVLRGDRIYEVTIEIPDRAR